MASPSQDNPHKEGTPTTSNSPHTEEDMYLHPEIPYVIPHEEINVFRRITRAYAGYIKAFPLAPFLPLKKVNPKTSCRHPRSHFCPHG
jgi:hypothetical protein